MSRVRVVVVEDLPTVRRRLVAILAGDPAFEIVGEAADGKAAIALVQTLRPDIVTLDMMLPAMTGLAATEYIMAHCPTPILIVSASCNRGELHHTYDALAAGAVDVLEKPSGGEAPGAWEARFCIAVKRTARIKAITHPRARLQPAAAFAPVPASTTSGGIAVIAIGASTGGPAAIREVLSALPAPFPIPLLLAIHIAEPFGAAFAEWLDGQSRHRVTLAADGDPLFAAPGLRVAPPNEHLAIDGGRLRLSGAPERNSCRPSIDTLFESMAQELGAAGAGCLLTGMGRDGAVGLLAVRQAGGFTIAQDEATSTVYGMPREAARLGAARRVLPLGAIGPALAALAEQS